MPFLPLHDSNPLRIIPFQAVTFGFIAACVLAFFWQLSFADWREAPAVVGLALYPATLFGIAELPPAYVTVAPELTLVTSTFLHGGWMHLIGNMLYLWVFGDNVEDSMGHFRFLVFYLVCGIAAGLAHAMVEPASEVPTIGASGAVSGVLGAYLMLHPKIRVLVLVLKRVPIRLPAYLVLGGWIALQVFNAVTETEPGGGGVAWWAHIGGFVAGMVLIVPFRYKHVPLFDGLRR